MCCSIIGYIPRKGSQSCHQSLHFIWHMVYPVATVLQTCGGMALLVYGSVMTWGHGPPDSSQEDPDLFLVSCFITVFGWIFIPCPRLVCGSMLSLVGCYCPRSEADVDEGMRAHREAQGHGGVVVDESASHASGYGTVPSKTAAARDSGFWANLIMAPREAFFEPFRQRLAVINNRQSAPPGGRER